MSELRKSGIDVLGDIPWGSHLCQFYETKRDLLDLLIPYFKTGLENNEFCLWITSNPLTQENVIQELKKAIPDFENYLSTKSIEILPHIEWYLKNGKFNPKEILTGWDEKLKKALESGYEGMRVNGNENWLEQEDWEDFMDYENELNHALRGKRVIVLCAYPLSKTTAASLLDVAHSHERAISRRKGHWEILEEPEIKKLKKQLKQRNDELEQQVTERTNELTIVIEKLQKEIAERKISELGLINEKELSKEIIDSIPGVFELYTQDFRFIRWNKQFEMVIGYSPEEIKKLHVVDDLTFGEEREKRYRILKKINETGRYEGEISITTKARKLIPLHFVGQLINYEGEPCFICTAIDITERKCMEEDLKRSELRYRTLVEQASDAIIVTDEKGKLIEMNTAFCKMFSFSEKELLGKDMAELVDPEQLKNDPLRIDLLLQGRHISKEMRMKKKDGTIFYTEANVQMLPDRRILAIVRDITERKRAEEALQKSEDYLRLVTDTIPALVISALPDGSVDFINQTYREFTGLSLDDVAGWGWTSVVHPEDREKIIDEWRTALATSRPMRTETRLRRANGDYRWVLVNAIPLHDESDNIVRWYFTKTDITELKQAEEELRRNEDRIRLIIDTIPTMAWSLGTDGVVDFLSQRWLDYSGVSLEQYVKDPEDPIHPEDRNRVFKKWKKCMAAGEFHEDEMRLRRADGKYRWFLVRTAPLRDEQGNILKWYGVSTDIEDNKRAEYELRKSYEEIRRLTEHLQKIREEERTHIAREIHDELGQQLTAIKMDVVWIDKKTTEEKNDIKRKLKNIITLLDGSNQSIRRILSELRPRLLDDHSWLEAIEWLSRQLTETTGIPVKFMAPEKEIRVSEQIATSIFRVCQEAFTNITRHANAKKVSVTISTTEKNIEMMIEDDGKGFAPASIQNIKSFGILGMRERIISRGGKFDLISSPGKGTKITVSLPVRNESRQLNIQTS